MDQVVQQTNQQNRPLNTAAAYDPKTAEWDAFCNHYYQHQPLQSRYSTVRQDKLYAYPVYHAYREQRKRGGTRVAGGIREAVVFDPSEFNEILKMYGELDMLNPDVSIVPDPKNGLACDQMNTYRSAVRKIWSSSSARFRAP
jgi:hypothetical protein